MVARAIFCLTLELIFVIQVMLQEVDADWRTDIASVQPASCSFSHITLTVRTYVIHCPCLCIIVTVSNCGSTAFFYMLIGSKKASVKNTVVRR